MKSPLALLGAVSAALILAASLSYFVVRALPAAPDAPHPAALVAPSARPAPAITSMVLPDTKGVNQAMSQWHGKILVVNFWATWCPPCREEMPAFSRISVKYAANGVQFVGISVDTLNNVLDFQKTNPVQYPLLIGTMETVQSTVALGNAAMGLPFTAIFDRGGRLHTVKLGKLAEEELEQHLKQLDAASGRQ